MCQVAGHRLEWSRSSPPDEGFHMPAPDPAERLLNLVIALSHTRVRMTRNEIRASVAGYDPVDDHDDPETARKRATAFERMFERDKEELRGFGIPLRTVTDPVHGNEIGYIIDQGEASMFPVSLTGIERAALVVAAEYWKNTALASDARRAVTKISSTTPIVEDTPLPLVARPSARADSAPVIAQAIADGQAVRFTYTSLTSGKSERIVEPWRIIICGGNLYLIGFDRDHDEPRTFRLNRIDGPVTRRGEKRAFLPPTGISGAFLEATVPTLTARIGILPDTGHAIRRRGTLVETDQGWDVFDVPYNDLEFLRDEILALSGSATIYSPDELTESVASYARAALEVTGG